MKPIIYTSYWSAFPWANNPRATAISKGTPNGFRGLVLDAMIMDWWLIKAGYPKEKFERIYHEKYLSKLDPEAWANSLDGRVLLCWEQPHQFCHRRTVANWIQKETGIEVLEWSPLVDKYDTTSFEKKETGKKEYDF